VFIFAAISLWTQSGNFWIHRRIRLREQTLKFLSMQFSPVFCHIFMIVFL